MGLFDSDSDSINENLALSKQILVSAKQLSIDVEHLHSHAISTDERTIILERSLSRIESRLEQGDARFDVTIGTPRKRQETKQMVKIELDNTQEVDITLSPGLAATGQPRQLDGPVNWVVTGTSARLLFTNIADPNMLSALVQTVDGAEGDTTIDLDADTKPGPDVVPLREQIVISVSAAGADTFGVKPGEPRQKTVPVPPAGAPPPLSGTRK